MSNSGVQNTGSGTINISRSAIGPNSTVFNAPDPESRGRQTPRRGRPESDIGVVTVLSEETSAVAYALRTAGH